MMKTLLLASTLLVAGLSMVPAASADCMDNPLLPGDGCTGSPDSPHDLFWHLTHPCQDPDCRTA